jgi:hypothetical protein
VILMVAGADYNAALAASIPSKLRTRLSKERARPNPVQIDNDKPNGRAPNRTELSVRVTERPFGGVPHSHIRGVSHPDSM